LYKLTVDYSVGNPARGVPADKKQK
jgi:hypothetical protein